MSRGSKIVPVRLPADLLEALELQIERRNRYSRRRPWNRSDAARYAIMQLLRKMARSRRGKRTNDVEPAIEGDE
jgi:Arc/MetJ-type ribon-helix-helix transcriptional regulator